VNHLKLTTWRGCTTFPSGENEKTEGGRQMAIAKRVDDYLREQGVEFDLIPHRTTGSTHESAMAAHVGDDHIAKAVVVRDDKGIAMAVIPGDSWLDMNILNRETDRDFRLDDEADLAGLFPDCAEGAVPAIGPAYGLETFLDEALTTLANLYFEAGDHRHLVHISGEALTRILPGVRRGYFSGQA
jgi:Ala-tRNA(Pro) deacylase